MINNFNNFIDESYLLSNNAPLYHHTNIYSLYDILKDDTLKVTNFNNKYLNTEIKMVSLSINPNLNLSYYKEFLDVVIELDRTLLKQKYKIIPYDFFIHNKKEDKPKSKIDRKQPFEFEEIVLKDIESIKSYLVSIDFKDDSISNPIFGSIFKILKERNIKIKKDGKEITI